MEIEKLIKQALLNSHSAFHGLNLNQTQSNKKIRV